MMKSFCTSVRSRDGVGWNEAKKIAGWDGSGAREKGVWQVRSVRVWPSESIRPIDLLFRFLLEQARFQASCARDRRRAFTLITFSVI